MQAELASVSGAPCPLAFQPRLQPRRPRPACETGASPGTNGAGRQLRALAQVAIACCAVLAIYGLVRYPALHHGTGAWFEVASFAALLAGYAATSLVICRGVGPTRRRLAPTPRSEAP